MGYLSDDDDTDPRNTSDSSIGDISDGSAAEESARAIHPMDLHLHLCGGQQEM